MVNKHGKSYGILTISHLLKGFISHEKYYVFKTSIFTLELDVLVL